MDDGGWPSRSRSMARVTRNTPQGRGSASITPSGGRDALAAPQGGDQPLTQRIERCRLQKAPHGRGSADQPLFDTALGHGSPTGVGGSHSRSPHLRLARGNPAGTWAARPVTKLEKDGGRKPRADGGQPPLDSTWSSYRQKAPRGRGSAEERVDVMDGHRGNPAGAGVSPPSTWVLRPSWTAPQGRESALH